MGNTQRNGQAALGNAQGLHELFQQYFAGVYGVHDYFRHNYNSLMIANDLDVLGVRSCPGKPDSPLFGDSYAPLTSAVPFPLALCHPPDMPALYSFLFICGILAVTAPGPAFWLY